MGLEGIIAALSLIAITIQFLAWRWAIGLARDLKGQQGHALMVVFSRLVGGLTIARLFGMTSLFVYDPGDLGPVMVIVAIASLVGNVVLIWAVWAVRQLSRREPPIYGPSEAVVEPTVVGPTGESAAEVPRPPRNIGATINHGNGDDLPLPAKLD